MSYGAENHHNHTHYSESSSEDYDDDYDDDDDWENEGGDHTYSRGYHRGPRYSHGRHAHINPRVGSGKRHMGANRDLASFEAPTEASASQPSSIPKGSLQKIADDLNTLLGHHSRQWHELQGNLQNARRNTNVLADRLDEAAGPNKPRLVREKRISEDKEDLLEDKVNQVGHQMKLAKRATVRRLQDEHKTLKSEAKVKREMREEALDLAADHKESADVLRQRLRRMNPSDEKYREREDRARKHADEHQKLKEHAQNLKTQARTADARARDRKRKSEAINTRLNETPAEVAQRWTEMEPAASDPVGVLVHTALLTTDQTKSQPDSEMQQRSLSSRSSKE